MSRKENPVFSEEVADYPNVYEGTEYPLNYIFTRPPDGVGGIVGFCQLEIMAGNNHVKDIKYLLIWNGEEVEEVSPAQLKRNGD